MTLLALRGHFAGDGIVDRALRQGLFFVRPSIDSTEGQDQELALALAQFEEYAQVLDLEQWGCRAN